jgi:hypothetical protein
MSAPLSNKQKADVAQIARRAFDHQIELGNLSEIVVFEDWRHSEQVKAVGKESLTSCVQDDFPVLMAHFCTLAGETGDALYWLNRAQTNPRRCALLKLEEACQEAGVAYPDYPAAIFRARHQSLEDAPVNKLWAMVFTVRNRRNSKHTGCSRACAKREEAA